MTDQIAWLENAGPGKYLGSKMPDLAKIQHIFVVESYNLEQVTQAYHSVIAYCKIMCQLDRPNAPVNLQYPFTGDVNFCFICP